jgi:hypothetical protein
MGPAEGEGDPPRAPIADLREDRLDSATLGARSGRRPIPIPAGLIPTRYEDQAGEARGSRRPFELLAPASSFTTKDAKITKGFGPRRLSLGVLDHGACGAPYAPAASWIAPVASSAWISPSS